MIEQNPKRREEFLNRLRKQSDLVDLGYDLEEKNILQRRGRKPKEIIITKNNKTYAPKR